MATYHARITRLAASFVLFAGGFAAAATPPPMPPAPGLDELDRGLCLIVGDEDGTYALDVAKRSSLTIYVQVETEAQQQAIARRADEAGLLGTRITVGRGSFDRLHLGDGLVDLLLDAGQLRTAPARARLNRHEVLRVLRPGGTAFLGEPQALTAPALAGQDDWTHPYHGPDNNPLSADRTVAAPYLTKFLAEPYFCPMPEVTVTAGGRMFKAFGNRSAMALTTGMVDTLTAFSAYNGTVLWTRKLSPGFMLHRNTLIATPEVLYLADDTSCQRIDAATGKLIDEIVAPAKLVDGPVWKWMALDGGVLYALVGDEEPRAPGLQQPGGGSWGWWKAPDYRFGYGRTFLAIDPQSKQVLWHRTESDPIDSRSVCMAAGRIFAYGDGKFVAAIDARDGATLWKTTDRETLDAIGAHLPAQSPLNGFLSTAYAKCSADALYFAGPARGRLVALDARTGKLLWQDRRHGDYQLVLREDALYALGRTSASWKFDLLTGKPLAELEDCTRGNCTRATGTLDSIFSRGHHHAGTLRIELSGEGARAQRMPVMRPGCHDGVLASNGQLYWGPWMCACNLSLVGIISLAPAGDFDFEQPAKEAERLERAVETETAEVAPFPIDERDWPTYRADNARRAGTPVAVAAAVRELWATGGADRRTDRRSVLRDAPQEPTAPVAAGGLVFISGTDGAVRALDTASGAPKWTAYTGGPVYYPPALWDGRLYVGSGDGYVHAFEAATGRPLWRFRAAPIERRIPVYGRLSSNWPVASGVLVDEGVVYAAAGIAQSDGTHVYALDAVSGGVKWQNNRSGRLALGDELRGVSVQGHLLLHDAKLHLAGGNVASPAIYDARNGDCLNLLAEGTLWKTKAPRGRDLSLVDGQVQCSASLLYAPREHVRSNYFGDLLLEAGRGDATVSATPKRIARRGADGNGEAWHVGPFAEPIALAVGENAALTAGKTAEGEYAVAALDLASGRTLWRQPLPGRPVSWGLAIDREGRVLVSLLDGRLVCYGTP
ncbi:MAG: PQQ-binding-like beta-propeller repeat protein [Planctomycetales bacterium]